MRGYTIWHVESTIKAPKPKVISCRKMITTTLELLQ